MALRAQFQLLILVLHLAVQVSSATDFNLVHLLVQDLILESLLKVMTPLEDVTRCYVQCFYIKKEKIKLF